MQFGRAKNNSSRFDNIVCIITLSLITPISHYMYIFVYLGVCVIYERMFMWKCRSFRDRKCLALRGFEHSIFEFMQNAPTTWAIRTRICCPISLNTGSGGIDIFVVKLVFGMLTVRGQHHSFSNHERYIYIWWQSWKLEIEQQNSDETNIWRTHRTTSWHGKVFRVIGHFILFFFFSFFFGVGGMGGGGGGGGGGGSHRSRVDSPHKGPVIERFSVFLVSLTKLLKDQSRFQ